MKKVCAITLVAMLLMSCLVGCGKGPAESNGGSSSILDVSQIPSGDNTTDIIGTGTSSAAAGDSTTAATQGGGKVTTTTGKISVIDPNVGLGSDVTGNFELPKFSGVAGTEVELFTWGSAASEASARWIKEFKDEYGATLKFYSVTQDKYDDALNGRMMSGDKPDVILIPTNGVYTYALNGYLEDITGKIDLNAPLWKGVANLNKSRFIGGKHYLIAVGAYVNDYIWFNRELMEDNGITDTPDKLYDQGKWTVQAMIDLAKQFTYTEKGAQYYGLAANYQTLGGNLIISRGAVMAEMNKSGRFVSRTGSSEMADAMGVLYDMYNKDKVVMPNSKADKTLDANAFASGQVAMCQYSSSLSSQDAFAERMKSRKISFVPFPQWDESTPARQRGVVSTFAVGKGCDNVNGALAFISMRRFGTADETAIKTEHDERRNVYFNTDKEIQYLDDAKSASVMASWEGLPKQQLMTMCQNVSMGGAWAKTLNQFEPQFLQGLKELNDLSSK